jgi:undecaprenyl-diphosphatase
MLARAARWALTVDRQITARVGLLVQRRPLLRWGATGLAHLGDGALCAALVLAAWFQWPGQRSLTLMMALAMLLAALLVMVIKLIVRRPRPEGAISAAWSSPPRYDAHSFPSGHAARVACLAAVLSGAYPAAAIYALPWAAAVSLARVAVGAHHVTDVLAGIGLGLVVARITPWAYAWLGLLRWGR